MDLITTENVREVAPRGKDSVVMLPQSGRSVAI